MWNPEMCNPEWYSINMNNILGVTGRKSSVQATVLDLSKAFDRVPHPLAINAEIVRLSWYENLSAKLDTWLAAQQITYSDARRS